MINILVVYIFISNCSNINHKKCFIITIFSLRFNSFSLNNPFIVNFELLSVVRVNFCRLLLILKFKSLS